MLLTISTTHTPATFEVISKALLVFAPPDADDARRPVLRVLRQARAVHPPPEVRREHALGGPEDCAPLVVYLASEAAAGVTGQAIGIGGDRLSTDPRLRTVRGLA